MPSVYLTSCLSSSSPPLPFRGGSCYNRRCCRGYGGQCCDPSLKHLRCNGEAKWHTLPPEALVADLKCGVDSIVLVHDHLDLVHVMLLRMLLRRLSVRVLLRRLTLRMLLRQLTLRMLLRRLPLRMLLLSFVRYLTSGGCICRLHRRRLVGRTCSCCGVVDRKSDGDAIPCAADSVSLLSHGVPPT